MGLCDRRILFCLSAFVVGLTYLTLPTFPDSASNHGIKVVMGTYARATLFMGYMGGLLGLSSVNITRALFGAHIHIDMKRATVTEYTTTMAGVEVMIFKPAHTHNGLRPGIIHYHGGGWVHFTPGHYAPVLRALVEQTQSIIISVNYRRAPEHVFPAAIQDCEKVTKFFLRNAEQYGVDKSRVGVKGDSAGGNLAMATALALIKYPDIPKLKFISLDYPALQAFDFNLPSYNKYEHGPGYLRKHLMLTFWLLYAFGDTKHFDEFYINNHTSQEIKVSEYTDYVSVDFLPVKLRNHMKGKDGISSGNKELWDEVKDIILNPLFAPLMAPDKDLKRLPSTYIMNAEFDVLRDEGFIAAERLRQLGVPVEHNYVTTEEHGFINLVDIDQYAMDEIVNFAKFFNKTVY